jgi:hypothetical protein
MLLTISYLLKKWQLQSRFPQTTKPLALTRQKSFEKPRYHLYPRELKAFLAKNTTKRDCRYHLSQINGAAGRVFQKQNNSLSFTERDS